MILLYLSGVSPKSRMKGFSSGLLVFATVFLLSSALPADTGKDRHRVLIDSEKNQENEKFLQRRKPPGKVPGPTLNSEEWDSGSLASIPHDEESKIKRLSDEDQRKKGKKDTHLKKYNKITKSDDTAPLDGYSKNDKGNSHKEKNFLRRNKYNSNWKEETQEEKSNIN